MFKKLFACFLAMLLCLTMLSCTPNEAAPKETETESESLSDTVESTEESETESDENTPSYNEVPKSLKILAIGNSFSVDAMEYLYQVAESAGVEEIVLGNLYIGGCNLASHKKHAEDDDSAYTYYKNTSGTWQTTPNTSFSAGLTDEDWDVITLQQVSGSSGLPETYGNDLEILLYYADGMKTNENARIFWHMTWAYQQDSTHSSFANYNKDQMTMYSRIVSTVQECILPHEMIDGVIPNGTAVQNARTSYIGDNLTRDGYHMEKTLGRYIVALTYFAAITGCDISDISYAPNGVNATAMAMAKASVQDAIQTPDAVTPSIYK